MTRTKNLVKEMVLAVTRFGRGDISREEFNRIILECHVGINGPEPGELPLDGIKIPETEHASVSDRIPTKNAIDCLAECYRAEGRTYLLMSMPKGARSGKVAVNHKDTDQRDAAVMIVSFLKGQPEVRQAVLHYYGEEAMDLRVSSEVTKATKGQDLDREIEASEAARAKVSG
jgi:hypothetical protein